MDIAEPILVPFPQEIHYTSGHMKEAHFPNPLPLTLPDSLSSLSDAVFSTQTLPYVNGNGPVRFIRESDFEQDSYTLIITREDITIAYSAPAGALYALTTLAQLIMQAGHGLPCCEIIDKPGLNVRGFMLDISRGKIPTLDTLYRLADLLTLLKYNHLELYIEGFSYAYRFFTKGWQGKSVITAEEFELLDAYCRARMIELVPCQNSLGHMAAWIGKEAFPELAESSVAGVFPPSTLNASDPASLELVGKMLEDLLPHFRSDQVNVCLDEPFELGTGKSKALAEEIGTDALYIRYTRSLYELLKKQGKSILMWGDIAGRSAKALQTLPEDITLLEWGYDADHPFDAHAAVLKEYGRRFIICPGTSGWTTFTGLTDNMLANVKHASVAAWKYGAEGMMLTEWGDFGHMQPLPVSFPALFLCAAYAWNGQGLSEDMLIKALNIILFEADGNDNGPGKLMLDSGRYDALEEYPLECKTQAAMPLITKMMAGGGPAPDIDEIASAFAHMFAGGSDSKYIRAAANPRTLYKKAILSYLDQLTDDWEAQTISSETGQQIRQAYLAALSLVKLMTRIRAVMRGGIPDPGLPAAAAKTADEIHSVWLQHNKPSDLEQTLDLIQELAREYA